MIGGESTLESLKTSVIALGSDQWYGLGIALGIEPSMIMASTYSMVTPADKLLALIAIKELAVGSERLRDVLLEACQNIKSPIRVLVEQKLRESSQ